MSKVDINAKPTIAPSEAASAVQHIGVGSVNEFLDAIRGFRADQREGQSVWYRGCICSRHQLLPSLLRPTGIDADEANRREQRLLTMYRQRSLPFWPEGYPQTNWEHLFSMQHHGVQTRLLDWSENAFVGLWFALEHECPRDHGGEDCAPVVWVLDPEELNRAALSYMYEESSPVQVLTTADEDLDPYGPGESLSRRPKPPVALYGSHNSRRIAAQRGTFTISGKEICTLEEFAERHPGLPPILRAIRLVSDVDRMRDDLKAFGFTTSMIYPDLPGLARDLADTV